MKKKEIELGKKRGKSEPIEMTYSRIASFLTCPMREYYQYQVEGVGIESTLPYIPFLEGEFLHYALKHFNKSDRMLRENLLKRVNKIVGRLEKESGIEAEESNRIRVHLAAMIGACLGYKMKYHSDREKYETLYVEEPFQIDFSGYVVKGIIDWICRDKETDKLILWENKSASQVSQDTYVALPMSLQDLLYCDGCKMLTDEHPDLMARNYVLKTKLRRKQSKTGGFETLAQYEARVTQQYLDEPDKKFFRPPPLRVYKKTVESVREQLKRILDLFKDVQGNPYMNFSQCTGQYGRACPFVQACTAKLQGHGDGWNSPEATGLYRLKKALHPELEEKEDAEENKT